MGRLEQPGCPDRIQAIGDLIDDHENWEYRIMESGSLSGRGLRRVRLTCRTLRATTTMRSSWASVPTT